MARTRRGGIDMLAGYELLTIGGPDPVPYAALDYVEIPVSIHYSSVLQFDVITVWGMGIVSFGPATLEQVLFMDRMATGFDPQLSEFPGDAVALGFSPQQYSTIELIKGNSELTGPWVRAGAALTISEDGVDLQWQSNGTQFGSVIDGETFIGGFSWANLDHINGTEAGETLNGTQYAETLHGLSGDDTVNGGAGSDVLDGGSGNDVLNGGAGNDRLDGGTGNDILNPGVEFRSLTGRTEILPFLSVNGGDGFDTLVLNYSAGPLSIVVDGQQLLSSDSVTGVEAVDITGSQYVDVVSGTSSNDRLFGGASYDVLRGGAGDDILDAGASGPSTVGEIADGDTGGGNVPSIDYLFTGTSSSATLSTTVTYIPLLVGGGGFESFTFSVTNPGAELWLDWSMFGSITGGWGFFDLVLTDSNGVEVTRDTGYDPAFPYILPQAGTYTLTGSVWSGSSWEYGYLNLDLTLQGADVLTSNRLFGGAGNDSYYVYAANDLVVENAGEGSDTVYSSVNWTLGANVENLTLTGSAASGSGNSLDNVIIGNALANTLDGGAGNDRIVHDATDNSANVTGGAGFDTLVFDGLPAQTTYNLTAGSFEAADAIQHDGGSASWATITSTYNATWQLTGRDIHNDDGTRALAHFDFNASQSWSETWDIFSAAGQRVSQDIRYDNGTRGWMNFDVDNSQNWTQVWFSYDVAGRIVSTDLFRDDGAHNFGYFDVDNQQNWNELYFIFDTQGRVASHDIRYDDGTRGWSNLDLDEAQSWSQSWLTYDAQGRLISQETRNDDGTRIWGSIDATNAQAWSDAWYGFDAQNRMTSLDVRFDDGRRNWTGYDAANAQAWANQSYHYDAAGHLFELVTTWDDGSTTATLY